MTRIEWIIVKQNKRITIISLSSWLKETFLWQISTTVSLYDHTQITLYIIIYLPYSRLSTNEIPFEFPSIELNYFELF